MTPLPVRIVRDGPLLHLTIDRPDKKNALTGDMYEALTDALATASSDAAIRAVCLTGSNGVFTAGNDLGDFLRWAGDLTDFPAIRFIRALARFDKPLVAAVDGLAIGIGTTLVLHCDLAYASPAALFRMPFVDLALVPEAGSSLLLPRRVGLAKAGEWLLLGEAFGAEEATRLGLVNAVIPADHLVDHAVAQALRLAEKPVAALMATRRLLRGDPAELLERIEREVEAFGTALASPEARARLAALQAKSAAKVDSRNPKVL